MEKQTGLIASFDPNTGKGGLITDEGEQIFFNVNEINVEGKIAAGMNVAYTLNPDKTSILEISTSG